MLSVRPATAADLAAVHEILHDVADWLHEQGYDQWPHDSASLGPERLAAQISHNEMHLVLDGVRLVGTIAVSAHGDSDFWTPRELAEPAVYISKAAIVRQRAGESLGAVVLRWVVDQANMQGARWARLDAWRTNTALHAYYTGQGWDYLRTVAVAGRNSGALFQKLALSDPQAQAALTGRLALPQLQTLAPEPLGGYPAGTSVITENWERGVVTDVYGPDWGHGVTEARWEQGVGRPPIIYTVQLVGGREILVGAGEITAAASLAKADLSPVES
jgi:hypothetical protein